MTHALSLLAASLGGPLASARDLVSATKSGWLFAASALLIVAGLGVEIWCYGVSLQSLTNRTLKDIESTHPHIPSLLTIAQIISVMVPLFVIGLLAQWGASAEPDLRLWMLFAALFLAGMAGFVLLELHGRSMSRLSSAFSTATTGIFLLFLLGKIGHTGSSLLMAVLVLLLCANLSCLWLLYRRERGKAIPVMFLLTAVFWLTLWGVIS